METTRAAFLSRGAKGAAGAWLMAVSGGAMRCGYGGGPGALRHRALQRSVSS